MEVTSTSFNIADIVVLVAIVLNIATGYKRGFILSVFKLSSFVLNIYLSYLLHPIITKYLKDYTNIDESIKESILKKISTLAKTQVDQITAQQQTKIISDLKLPQSLQDSLIKNNTPDMYSTLGVNNFVEYIATFISNICMSVIGVIIVFIIASIVLHVCVKVLDIISKLPIINSLNKTLGIALGFIIGIIQVYVGCFVLTLFASNKGLINIFSAIKTSSLAKYFYDNNILYTFVINMFIKK